MTDLHTLSSSMSSAISLANHALPHVDRIDRRRLMDARDRLTRFHAALLADMKRQMDGPFSTLGCWQTREPGIRDIIRDVERIVKTAGLVPGEPERPLSSGENQLAGADHAPAPASRNGSGKSRQALVPVRRGIAA